ncbi:cupredoxin domain-containing protein [Edaphobacter aggregans]|uniref:cupredoxin domain-containing protein n=1 Tax=Edaphobacter aggregans TaxID=570835 RepID=UPI00054E0640|nr:cupredoxin domain-containing protein [Edaphobacter aggregans]
MALYLTVLLPLLPADASAHGPALDHHLLLNLWIILALAALAHALLLAGLALRRSTEARHLLTIEYLPLALLAVTFTALAIHAERLWAATRYTGASHEAMQIEVTGLQFAWYFRYPGPDATFGVTRPQLASPGEGNPVGLDPADPHSPDDVVTSELVLPANREVDLTLRAQDVIHGFSVPELRLKQNAVPGESIHIHFTPTTPGTYAILCTQLCGLGHYRMNANLRVLPTDDFRSWLAAKEKTAHP